LGHWQAGSVLVPMSADDFTVPVDTVIFIASHNSDDTILKFSPTSPTRTHAHQLLNIRHTEGFDDRKQLMHHAAPPALHAACVQTGTGVRRGWRPVENVLLSIFFIQLSKSSLLMV
jgi:hypothetical protein